MVGAIAHALSDAHIRIMKYLKKGSPSAQQRPEPRADGLAIGSTVRHPTFGLGPITRIDGERLTILFKDGSRKIAASYVKAA